MSTNMERTIAEADSLLVELRRAVDTALSPILVSASRNGSGSEVILTAASCVARDLIGSMVAQMAKPGHEMALVDRLLAIMRSELAAQDWAEERARQRSSGREAVPERVLS